MPGITTPTRYQIRRRFGWYWIWHNDARPRLLGPYATRADAREDRRGLVDFDRNADRPGFMTIDPRPRKAAK